MKVVTLPGSPRTNGNSATVDGVPAKVLAAGRRGGPATLGLTPAIAQPVR